MKKLLTTVISFSLLIFILTNYNGFKAYFLMTRGYWAEKKFDYTKAEFSKSNTLFSFGYSFSKTSNFLNSTEDSLMLGTSESRYKLGFGNSICLHDKCSVMGQIVKVKKDTIVFVIYNLPSEKLNKETLQMKDNNWIWEVRYLIKMKEIPKRRANVETNYYNI